MRLKFWICGILTNFFEISKVTANYEHPHDSTSIGFFWFLDAFALKLCLVYTYIIQNPIGIYETDDSTIYTILTTYILIEMHFPSSVSYIPHSV